jgi:CHASE3 domain sensor protein
MHKPRPVPALAAAPSLRKQKAAMWTAIIIILGVSLLAILSIQKLIAASERVQASEMMAIETQRFLSDLKDVEAGGRGFALSDGDDRHLQRQMQGIADAQATARRMQTVSSDPQWQRVLVRLFPLAAQRIKSSRQLVAERRDRTATRANLLAGMLLMDRIRVQVADITAGQLEQSRQDRRAL